MRGFARFGRRPAADDSDEICISLESDEAHLWWTDLEIRHRPTPKKHGPLVEPKPVRQQSGFQQYYTNESLFEHNQPRPVKDPDKEACEVLGVSPSASWSEITHAYREQAKRHHPDRSGDDDAMIAINQAFAKLRHARRK